MSTRNKRGIVFFSTKLPPQRGSRPIRFEHKRRLMLLCKKLGREHNWKEQAGVLSTLLTGDIHDTSMELRLIYLASMATRNMIDGNNSSLWKTKSVYEAWMRRNVSSGKGLLKKNYLIQLEFVLLLLIQGKYEEAYNIMKFLIADADAQLDPYVSMVAGFVSYQVWCASLPHELQLKEEEIFSFLDENVVQIGSLTSKSELSNPAISNYIGSTHDVQMLGQCISNRSICYGFSCMDIDGNTDRQAQQFPSTNGFHMDFMETSKSNDGVGISIPISYFHEPQTIEESDFDVHMQNETAREHYLNALKYLRIAVHSDPPLLVALLPLMQLLLLGDYMEEALMEVKSLSLHSSALLTSRINATLLERFSVNDDYLLSSSHEGIMKQDPTCKCSLTVLINMYKKGVYDLERVVEMIASHLDVVYAGTRIWEELSLCLSILQNRAYTCADQTSTLNELCDGSLPISCLLPRPFTSCQMRHSWMFRLKWWKSRHFSIKSFDLNVNAGDWHLIVFKAACATHFYGPKFSYVEKAVNHFRRNDDQEKITLLQGHLQNSLNLLKKLKGVRSKEFQRG